ncbi:hypothetical protein [Amycolatopsis echigonensis]|uniref:MFS transporter n=1 Tax=Amycolatopsis echigonensis TaxID=2576905 RepID=A0A8E1W2F1_9PSEU|nr:hypothetical protein [Amycolatopsis echigonensis]MBB2502482.1 hypothetical protein [Amycolatopsis echigonensis]
MPRTAAAEETGPFTRRAKIGIATALPRIAADLGGPGSMTWIVTAYALAIAARCTAHCGSV